MSILKFSDGESFDTSGTPRIEERSDGLYVLGRGNLLPIENRHEAIKAVWSLQTPKERLATEIIGRALRSKFISKEEAEKIEIQEIALEVVGYQGEVEEIGSSDWTFLIKELLDDMGKKTDFVKGYLKVIS